MVLMFFQNKLILTTSLLHNFQNHPRNSTWHIRIVNIFSFNLFIHFLLFFLLDINLRPRDNFVVKMVQ